MEAKELRISNYITDEENNIREVQGLANSDEETLFLPIPLTEEWLLKFGFNTNDSCFWISISEYIDISINNDMIVELSIEDCFYSTKINNIKHVHQLQNLYFALTGEELSC